MADRIQINSQSSASQPPPLAGTTGPSQHHIFGWPMSILFVTLLLVFVYLPIDIELPASLFAPMFSAVLLAITFAVRPQGLRRTLSIWLAVLSVVLAWAATLIIDSPAWLELAAFGTSAAFVAYTMYIIVILLWRVQSVAVHTISAALSLYLLLGILGGLLFAIIETAVPGSVGTNTGATLVHIQRTVDLFPPLLYFSFTTLTTVGFGDLYPASPAARSLTILEAVAGQIYLVVMVAALVSMFAATRSQREAAVLAELHAEDRDGVPESGSEPSLIDQTEQLQ